MIDQLMIVVFSKHLLSVFDPMTNQEYYLTKRFETITLYHFSNFECSKDLIKSWSLEKENRNLVTLSNYLLGNFAFASSHSIDLKSLSFSILLSLILYLNQLSCLD